MLLYCRVTNGAIIKASRPADPRRVEIQTPCYNSPSIHTAILLCVHYMAHLKSRVFGELTVHLIYTYTVCYKYNVQFKWIYVYSPESFMLLFEK